MKRMSQVAAAGFMLAFMISFNPVTHASNQSVDIHFVNDNDINCHKANDPADSIQKNGVISWTANITNHGPGGILVEKAAFHNDTAGCAATSDNVFQDQFQMTGQTVYNQGQTGSTSFSYNLNTFNCGRVQVDAGYVNADGSGPSTVFLGELIDYGHDCTTPPPPIGPSTLSGTCTWVSSAPQINLSWTPVDNQNSNSLQRRVNGGNWSFYYQDPAPFHTFSYTDQDLILGSTYEYRVKTDPQVASNIVSITATATNCGGIVNQPPTGSLDAATCDLVGGWAADPDTTAPIQVKIYDGPAATGTLVTTVTADKTRSDVGAHAFDIRPAPQAFQDGKSHSVYAYAVDSSGGPDVLLLNAPKTISGCGTPINHRPIGILDAADCNIIGGWAFDPDVSSQEINVIVSIDGSTLGTFPTTGLRADVNSQYGITGNHGFTITTPASLKDGPNHTVSVGMMDVLPPGAAAVTQTFFQLTGSPKTINCPAAAGTMTLTKNVRDVSSGQTTFSNSITANSGDQVEFQITAKATNGDVANVLVSDSLPGKLTYVNNSLTLDGAVAGNSLSVISLGNMTSGSSRIVVFRATVADASQFSVGTTTLTNTANLTSAANNASASATVNVTTIGTNPNLTVTKLVRDVSSGQSAFVNSLGANPADLLQFQIQVTNNGSAAAQNVTVTDILPSGMLLNSGSSVFNLGTIAPGASQTITLNAQLASSSNFSCGQTNLTNTAAVSATNANNVQATAGVTVNNFTCSGNASLSLTKQVRNLTTGTALSSSANASVGDQVQFSLTVTASGSTSANNVRVTDFLPAGLTYVPGTFSASSGFSSGSLFNGGQFLGSMFSGQSITMTFNAAASSSASATLTNTAQATADNAGTANAQASVFVSSVLGGNVNLNLSKRAFNQTQNVDATTTIANPGDVIVYTLAVDNRGNAPATNYIFQDNVANILQLAQLQDFPGGTLDFGQLTLTWPAQTIAAGAHMEKSFSVKVNNTFPANSDKLMVNTFGNTVTVTVRKPIVAGAFIAPKTGSTTTAALVLSFLVLAGFVAVRQKEQLRNLVTRLVR